jgi:ABC-2 type transport system ATP-binding protein
MIKINSVCKKFKNDFWNPPFEALSNVNFSISKEHITGFVGANGAGKTTLFKIIMQFIRPSSGSIQYSDLLGVDKDNLLKKIGFLPERPYFYPHISGKEYLKYMVNLSLPFNRHTEKNNLLQSAYNWCERLKIQHALDKQLKTYSKGMLQRISFIASFIHRPALLILDEPFSGLDPIGRKEFKDIFQELFNNGLAIFFSSHVVSDIDELCHHFIFMEKGKVLYTGSPESLRKNQLPTFLIDCTIQTSYLDQLHLPFVTLKEGSTQKIIQVQVQESHTTSVIEKLLSCKAQISSIKVEKESLEDILYLKKGNHFL